MPKPKSGESKQDFISRCMGYDDMQKYDQDQRAAICYSYWDNRNKEGVENMTISPYVEEVSKVTGVEVEKLQPHWKKAKQLTSEQFGISEEEFKSKQFKHAQETLKELYGLKINKVDIKEFIETDLSVDEFLEQTVSSGDFPSLDKGTVSKKKDDDKDEEETGPGGHVPDGTGPHGRGEGPGKGKADGSGLDKKKEEILKEKVTLDKDGHLLNMYGDELEEQEQGLYTIDCPKDIKISGKEIEEGSPVIIQNEYEDVDQKYVVEVRIPNTNLSTLIRFDNKQQAQKYGWIK